jgi:hypothetical protein
VSRVRDAAQATPLDGCADEVGGRIYGEGKRAQGPSLRDRIALQGDVDPGGVKLRPVASALRPNREVLVDRLPADKRSRSRAPPRGSRDPPLRRPWGAARRTRSRRRGTRGKSTVPSTIPHHVAGRVDGALQPDLLRSAGRTSPSSSRALTANKNHGRVRIQNASLWAKLRIGRACTSCLRRHGNSTIRVSKWHSGVHW